MKINHNNNCMVHQFIKLTMVEKGKDYTIYIKLANYFQITSKP